MAIDFSDGSDYVIYTTSGKTFIGKFHKGIPSDITRENGIHNVLGYETGSYIVENPAEIIFNLQIPPTGSADLKWTIHPIFYNDMIGSNESDYRSIFFTYPKSQIAISSIGGDIIDSELLSAYKELCE